MRAEGAEKDVEILVDVRMQKLDRILALGSSPYNGNAGLGFEAGCFILQRDKPAHNRENHSEEVRMTSVDSRETTSTHSACVVAAITTLLLGLACPIHGAAPKTSGVYLTAVDYADGKLAFEGDCKSTAHRLVLHDVLNKPYIDVTHESEKRRYQKSDLFGLRACDGRDYRFSANLEYQILESKDLYIYARDEQATYGKGMPQTIRSYYFSVGAGGPILSLTLQNVKQAIPDNHKFHDLLDANFGAGQKIEQYDDFHKMFKVNRLLIASRE
jgi:hypothetical protein